MPFAPYQWRAGKGYLPPPNSAPAPVIPMPVYYYPGAWPGPYLAVPPAGQQPSVASTPAPAPPAPPAKKEEKPAKKVEEKIKKVIVIDKTIASLPSVAPGESSTGGPPPGPAPAKSTKSSKTAKTTAHSTNNQTPPSIRVGTNYLFPSPKEHTHLHIFSKAAPVWADKYKGQHLQFKICKVFTGMTVRQVMERVLKREGEGCEGWVVTEVYERGEGEWRKGTSIEYESDKAKGTLASMGWGPKRGGELPPVWLTVHKA